MFGGTVSLLNTESCSSLEYFIQSLQNVEFIPMQNSYCDTETLIVQLTRLTNVSFSVIFKLQDSYRIEQILFSKFP
jgi:hypothetical protein